MRECIQQVRPTCYWHNDFVSTSSAIRIELWITDNISYLPVGYSQEQGRMVQWYVTLIFLLSRSFSLFIVSSRTTLSWPGLLTDRTTKRSTLKRQHVYRFHAGDSSIVVVVAGSPPASLLRIEMPIVVKEWAVQCLINCRHISDYDYRVGGSSD